MDKQTILNELTQNGNIHSLRRSPTWEKAFDLYNSQNTSKLKMGCGPCFRQVLAWLRS